MSNALAKLHQDLRDLVGQTLAGRYRIDALVGVGGMAAVFRAHHEGLKRDLAVKVLHPNLSANSEMSARFEREARSASRLDHPNCVQVTDFGSTEDGMMYMVMQLLEGEELTGMLGRRLSAPRAVELVLQILRGLEHAHGKGVIHRDIKPENVFVTRDHDGDEVLKLVDFGIAKLTDATVDTHKTSAGLVFGTPAYMAPEQAMGVEADSRADLYSTGILFYQMLSGRLPIDNEDPVALVRMQVAVDPDPLPSSVPPVIAGVAGRLLEKDRDRRFQTATEVIETLESIEPMLVDEHISDVEITTPASDPGTTGVQVIPAGEQPSLASKRPPWRIVALAGAVFTVGAAVLVVRASGDDDAEVTETRTAVSDDRDASADPDHGPPAGVLSEIDRLLLAKRGAEADALLAPLREEFPEDATLMWRHARVLAVQRRKTAEALEAYGQALDADPDLLDNKDFYAELHDLLRNRNARQEALDFTLEHMGENGANFLLETVNDEKEPLQYDERHRVLEALRENPDNAPLINERLNVALDILQASASERPCASYSAALDMIAAEPEFYFYNRVDKAEVPPVPEGAAQEQSKDQTDLCAELPGRRESLLAQLAVLNPDAEELIEIEDEDGPAAVEPESPSKAPRKKRTSKRPPECNKFGAAFNKKCRGR